MARFLPVDLHSLRAGGAPFSDVSDLHPETVQSRELVISGISHFTLDGEEYPYALLRIYRNYHPDAKIYTVSINGNKRWLTSNQVGIWKFFQHSRRRHVRLTLNKIATTVGCSRSTVSRFLHRLALWGCFDLLTMVGRNGFVRVDTRNKMLEESDIYYSGARRMRQSLRLLMYRKRRQYKELAKRMQELEDHFRRRRKPTRLADAPSVWGMASGIMDATFTRLSGMSGEAYSTPVRKPRNYSH